MDEKEFGIEDDTYTKTFVETYKNHRIYTNGHCHSVRLGKYERFFYNDGTNLGQILRCKKEVDDFEMGLIK